MLDNIFLIISRITGIISIYLILTRIAPIEEEYKIYYKCVFFHFFGVLCLVLAFVGITFFFFKVDNLDIPDYLDISIQMIFGGYISIGESEKIYLIKRKTQGKDYDAKRIKEINETQLTIVLMLFVCFWL